MPLNTFASSAKTSTAAPPWTAAHSTCPCWSSSSRAGSDLTRWSTRSLLAGRPTLTPRAISNDDSWHSPFVLFNCLYTLTQARERKGLGLPRREYAQVVAADLELVPSVEPAVPVVVPAVVPVVV